MLLMIVFFSTCLVYAQNTPTDSISITVKDVRLENVLWILSQKSGLEFISDPVVKDKQISLDLKGILPLEALSILTELYDLGYQELSASGKYIVTERSELEIQTQLDSYMCEFAQASDLAQVVARVATLNVGSVFADNRTNTIIYQDTPAKLIEIERLIRKLDKPTRQVYIKSVIAEISMTEDQVRGVQWFTEQPFKDVTIVGGTNFTTLGNLPAELSFPAIGAGLGVGILDYDIEVALGFLARISDLEILSAPYLIVQDNQSAVIEVGDQIPYPKLNEFGVTSYEFKDATIRLSIRPHINNDSTITIFLEPQANFQKGFTPDNIPIIAKRSAQTQVVVKNGKTVVLGGLMRQSDVSTITKVPILGSIPFIGELFKSTQITKEKTELIIMITPKIIDLYSEEMNPDSYLGIPETMKEYIK